MIQRERKKKRGGNFESKKKLQRIHPRPCFYSPSHRETGLHGRQDDCLSPLSPFLVLFQLPAPWPKLKLRSHDVRVHLSMREKGCFEWKRDKRSAISPFFSLSPINGNSGGAITGSAIFSNYRYK